MRLLQIDPNGSETTALDFHPMVTVVTGLTPSGRDIVLRVARSLARADDPGFGGLLEAHGVLLDLNRDTLELLELHTDTDVLITGDDLPDLAGDEASADDELASTAAPVAAEVDQPRSGAEIDEFIESTPTGRYDDLDQARQRQATSREALEILREAAQKANAEFDKVLAREKLAEAELAAAREANVPRLRLVVDDEAEGDEPAEPQIDEAEIRRQRADLTEKIENLDERIASHTRGLEELSTIDTRPLTVLLDAIRNPAPIEYVPSERANELADEVIDLERKVAQLEKELDKRGLASGAALKQLESSRAELASAEKAMSKPELTSDDISELEAVHEEVLEAQTKASGAFKRGGQKRLEQVLARQQEILDRIGFPTWSAYVMGAGLLAIDHAAEQRLEKARLDMEAAESHWASVCQEIEANPEHRRLLDRLEDVYLEAFDLLGGSEPDDLEGALRDLQVPKREVTTEELVDALSYQLELVGLELPDGATSDLVIMASEAFVEEASSVEERVAELRDERATAEAERAVARDHLADLPELPEPEPEPATNDALGGADSSDPWGFGSASTDAPPSDAASSAFDSFDPSDPFGVGGDDGDEGSDDDGATSEAEAAEAAAEAAELEAAAQIEALERAVEEAVEEVAEYTEWLESREALVDAALTVETISTSRLRKLAADLLDEAEPRAAASANGDAPTAPSSDAGSGAGSNGNGASPAPDIETYLSERLDAQRHLSYAGSVPLVLNDAFERLDDDEVRRMLDHLQQVAESVQVIYLTDDSTVAGWAEEVGFQRAAVVPAPIGFG